MDRGEVTDGRLDSFPAVFSSCIYVFIFTFLFFIFYFFAQSARLCRHRRSDGPKAVVRLAALDLRPADKVNSRVKKTWGRNARNEGNVGNRITSLAGRER